MAKKSVSKEAAEINLAAAMIKLGARLQVVQAETTISYDRLARLYKEIRQESPPKGMLPFSVDWFMTWRPNIHSSMFYNIFMVIKQNTNNQDNYVHALVQAYSLYLEQAYPGVPLGDIYKNEPVLSFTRAWILVRFFDSGLVQLSTCQNCHGLFVAHAHDLQDDFVCAICKPPPRAGKTRKRKNNITQEKV